MKIRSVEFAGSVVDPKAPLPDALPQLAFSGRSNVGKSSLINTLLGRTRSKPARVSGEPGKTRTLNFFRVNDDFFLVDLPGYGYARVSAAMQASWRDLVEGYLSREDGPVGVVHLVDVRRDPMPQDRQMLEYLASLSMPTLVVLTKVDKLNRSERSRRIPSLRRAFGLDEEQVIPFSARTGEGRDALLAAVAALLEQEGDGGKRGGTVALSVLLPLLVGCGLLAGEGPTGALAPEPGDPAEETVVTGTQEVEGELPAGYGTFRQDDISVTLRRGDLQVMVTPLEESVIRVTASDTYARLAGVARARGEELARRMPAAGETRLFLVSMFSEAPDVGFEPDDVNLVSRGFRHRPLAVSPVTPGWGSHRLEQRRMEMAVYAFPRDVDPDDEFEVEYQGIRNRDWERILPRIQAERARVRARAGTTGLPFP